MADYKDMYFKLAGQVADAIEALGRLSDFLINAQREAEKLFIEESDKNTGEL